MMGGLNDEVGLIQRGGKGEEQRKVRELPKRRDPPGLMECCSKRGRSNAGNTYIKGRGFKSSGIDISGEKRKLR